MRRSALPLAAVHRTSAGGLQIPLARRAALQVRPMRRTRLPFWVWLGLLGIAFAALLPVLQLSDVTQAGANVRELERERAGLQAEVRLLASQVGELAALSRVEEAATRRLGLTPARPTTILSVDTPPPSRLLPTRLLPRRDNPVVRTLPWWQQVLNVLIVR